jgi:hypothetical protein
MRQTVGLVGDPGCQYVIAGNHQVTGGSAALLAGLSDDQIDVISAEIVFHFAGPLVSPYLG